MIIIGVKNTNVSLIEEKFKAILEAKNQKLDYKILPTDDYNRNWVTISIDDESDDQVQLEKIEPLFEELSRELQTAVLAFENVDVVESYFVSYFENGELVDALNSVDFQVFTNIVLFKDLEENIDDLDDLKLSEYFDRIGFDPLSVDVL